MSKFLSIIEDLYAGAKGKLKGEDEINIASELCNMSKNVNYDVCARDVVDMFDGNTPTIFTKYDELRLDEMIIDFIYFTFSEDSNSVIAEYLNRIEDISLCNDSRFKLVRGILSLFGTALYEELVLTRLGNIEDNNAYNLVKEFLELYFNYEIEFNEFTKNMFLGRYDKSTVRAIVDTLSSVGLEIICKDIRKYWSGNSTLYNNLRANVEYHNNCVSNLWEFDEFMKDISSAVVTKNSLLSNEFLPILEFLFISATREDSYIYSEDVMDRLVSLTPNSKDIELFAKSMESEDYSIYTHLDSKRSDEFEDELLRCRFDSADSIIIDYVNEYALDTNLPHYKLEMVQESIRLFVNYYAFNRLLYKLETNKDNEYSNKAIDLINLYFLPQTVSFKKALYGTGFNLDSDDFDAESSAKEILNIITNEKWSFMKRFIELYGDKTLPNYRMMADAYTSNKVALYNVDNLFMKAKEIILGDK